MVAEQHVTMERCQKVRYVTEYQRHYRPYTTCRMVPDVVRYCVPQTTCHLEAYCEKFQACRMVPYCVPVCEPACPPACPPALPTACDWKKKWFAHLTSRLSGSACCGN
jgi:hypothetical protein